MHALSMSWSDTTCRACFADASKDFFEFRAQCNFSSDNLTYHEVFNICTYLEINQNDGLPQRLCVVCAKELRSVYDFQHKVLETNQKLKNLTNNRITNEMRRDFIKDPLENVTDMDESDEGEQDFTLNIDDNNNEDNDDNKTGEYTSESPLAALTSDSDVIDNDFPESVETQIFPEGRFLCKVCEKAKYFTNVGLQAHMEIHKPKRKKQNHKESSKKSKTARMREKPKIHVNDEINNESDENDNKDLHDGKAQNELDAWINVDALIKPKKTFPCQVCGKQMISVSKLRYHMVMHTGEKDFLCTMCPKAYSTIYALKHHMRAHTGERPYECKFCGDRFLRPTTLKSHMRRHTGERPYGCDICGKRFIQHSSMATHIKLNHMDKTIACQYCDKKYARQTDLNTHLLSHSGEKPYACKMCPSRFTRQSNLNKHMNQQHQNGGTDEDDERYLKGSKIKCLEEKNLQIVKNQTMETKYKNTAENDHKQSYDEYCNYTL